MKRGFLAVIFLGVAISVSGCGKREDVSSDEVFSVDDIAEIDMDVSSWDVRVLASSDDGIHVEHEGKVGDKDSVQVQQEDDKLLIQQHAAAKNMAEGFSFGREGKITLYIPKEDAVSLDITNGSGDMELETVHIADLSLDNDAGYVSMSGVRIEDAEIGSVSGDIKMTDGSCMGSYIHTGSAYVTFKGVEFCEAAISTESGEVGIKDVEDHESLSVETGSGDITVSYAAPPDDLAYEISSGSDDVTVDFPHDGPAVYTDGCRQGSIGKGQKSLSIVSDSGTVVVGV